MYRKKVEDFISRLDEIEQELQTPESMKLSEINKWCRKILSYEDKIPLMKKYVFQADLDFYENVASRQESLLYADNLLKELDYQEQAENRFYQFCCFIDEKINEAKAYAKDFEKNLIEYQDLKNNVVRLSELHWLHAAV